MTETCEECNIPLTPGALPDGTPTLGCDECGFSWDMEGDDNEPSKEAEINTLPSPATALYAAAKAAREALVTEYANTAAAWGAVSEKAIKYATNRPEVVALDAALKAWEAAGKQ